jgi:hypothetical protein
MRYEPSGPVDGGAGARARIDVHIENPARHDREVERIARGRQPLHQVVLGVLDDAGMAARRVI